MFDSKAIEKLIEELEARKDRALPFSQAEVIRAKEAGNKISLLNALQTARVAEGVVTLTDLLQRALKANVQVLEGIERKLVTLNKTLDSFGFAQLPAEAPEEGELNLIQKSREAETFEHGGGI